MNYCEVNTHVTTTQIKIYSIANTPGKPSPIITQSLVPRDNYDFDFISYIY